MSAPTGVVGLTEQHPWSGSFSVADSAGAVLCRGESAELGRRWDVVDGQGRPVLRQTGWGREVRVRFASGRQCHARRAFLRRAWSMTDDAAGETAVLRSVDRARGGDPATTLGLPPRTWLVEQDGSLSLVEFVAAVQVYRVAEARRRRLLDLVPA